MSSVPVFYLVFQAQLFILIFPCLFGPHTPLFMSWFNIFFHIHEDIGGSCLLFCHVVIVYLFRHCCTCYLIRWVSERATMCIVVYMFSSEDTFPTKLVLSFYPMGPRVPCGTVGLQACGQEHLASPVCSFYKLKRWSSDAKEVFNLPTIDLPISKEALM